jgi:hypothetical protein
MRNTRDAGLYNERAEEYKKRDGKEKLISTDRYVRGIRIPASAATAQK